MGNKIKIRVTYLSPTGTLYSEIGYFDNEDDIEIGEWFAPFPNEEGNSTAFDLVKFLEQSEYCPLSLYKNGIIGVKVKKYKEYPYSPFII